ncbi:MAG TPA: YoaK family protein [Chloroflexota bacterium]|nr:YoaK family protein [Chloroflexota bacterium]
MQAHAVASLPVGRIGHFNEAWLTWVALTLSVIGGFVDAVGYLALFRLFTAHMSGNTAAAGADLARLEWSTALRSLIPIATFLLGVCLGAAIKQEGSRRGLRSWFAVSCGLECLLLTTLMTFGQGPADDGLLEQNSRAYVVLATLPCLAMGIQSASFQRVGSVGVRTTFITGILTGLGEELVSSVYAGRHEREPAGGAEVSLSAPNQATLERALLFGGLWLAYLVGGLLAGVGLLLWRLGALILPVVALAGLAILDVVRPLQPSVSRA